MQSIRVITLKQFVDFLDPARLEITGFGPSVVGRSVLCATDYGPRSAGAIWLGPSPEGIDSRGSLINSFTTMDVRTCPQFQQYEYVNNGVIKNMKRGRCSCEERVAILRRFRARLRDVIIFSARFLPVAINFRQLELSNGETLAVPAAKRCANTLCTQRNHNNSASHIWKRSQFERKHGEFV